MQTINVTPQDVVTGAPVGARAMSPEAADVVGRMKDFYRQQGKSAAAANYSRHLKAFFSWAESQGYAIRSLPSDAVESFLSALAAAGQKETTLYVMRSQLKAALREAHDVLGLDVGHLEFVSGKPPTVRKAQKEKEKQKRAVERQQEVLAQAAAIQAAQAVMGMQPPVTPPPATPRMTHEEYPMSEPTPPTVNGAAPAGASAPVQQPTVIVVPQAAAGANPGGNRGTIGNPAPARAPAPTAAQPARGVVINNHTFTGAFVKISYLSDGSNPFNPPGTETYLTTMPASQLAPHGDLGSFLQQYIVPTMRLAPTTSQVAFVFHELNDRRQPTGRRDELVVGIPLAVGAAPAAPAPGLAGFPSFGAPAAAPQDSATTYLLKKLDEEAAEAKRRAEEYQVQMREAKDAQTVFMLTQAFQREQDLRKELEEKRAREEARLAAPPIMAAPPPPPPPMPLFPPSMFEPPKPDTSATDMVKALADNQSRMMEVMATAMKPQPAPPQKDTAEWLIPFINQMNQQAQAQAQANQALLMQVMQSNQQFMQAMLTRENPVEKMLMLQLQEVKAAASAPKEDELEAFADKLQKMKMVNDMMGGGGSSNLLTELLANADTIGAGAAKVIEAAKGNSLGNANGTPTKQVAQERAQLTGAPATPKLAAPTQGESEFPPPPPTVLEAHKALVAGVEKRNDEETAQAFLVFLREMVTAQEPYASMGRRLMTAFQQAEDEGELYTLGKNLWIVVGQKSLRPQAKYVARVLAEYYSNLHQTIFGEPRALPEDEELEGGEQTEDSEEGVPDAAEGPAEEGAA